MQSTQLLMASSEAAYKAIAACWADEIFLRDLAARFWKLTLQIVSRYRTWLDTHLPDYTQAAAAPVQAGLAAVQGQAGAMQRTGSGVNLQRVSAPLFRNGQENDADVNVLWYDTVASKRPVWVQRF